MSLWLQSLSMRLDRVGDGDTPDLCRRRAKIILAYLSMPVPRNIVVGQLVSERIDTGHVLFEIMHNCLRMLHAVDELRGLTLSHTLALGFTDELDDGALRFSDTESDHSLSAYRVAAERVLQARPELRRLAERIEQVPEQGSGDDLGRPGTPGGSVQ